jgi:hypothetical protein
MSPEKINRVVSSYVVKAPGKWRKGDSINFVFALIRKNKPDFR